jgi:branched-subunit amino acid ABC-type transport system permease component
VRAVIPAARRRGHYRPVVRLNSRPVVVIAAIAGIILIALAVYYWAEPARSLPSWLPGHEAGSNHHHFKHGLAAFLVGLALLIFAWFQSAPRRTSTAA